MKRSLLFMLGVAAAVGSSVSAVAQETVTLEAPTAVTPVLSQETISGVESLTLPTPPVMPARFTLPIDVVVAKDASITTNTPITDSKATDYAAWGEMIRECLKSYPVLVRVVSKDQVPFVVNGKQGSIKLNANDKPVCPM
jgi:hypothetical protein